MLWKRLKTGHDLADVVDDANETDGGEGQQDEHNEWVAEHAAPGGRAASSVQVLSPG